MHRGERFLRDRLERLEDADSVERGAFEDFEAFGVQVTVQQVDRNDVPRSRLLY